jgi:AraC-like DNA-binding protein
MPLLELNNVQVEYLEVGTHNNFPNGWLHHKILPFAIFTQALEGSYQVVIGGHTETIAKGEIAFVPSNTPVTFIHHAAKSGTMAARWLHLRATLHGSADLMDLLTIPGKLGHKSARFLGVSIARVLSLTDGTADSGLIPTLRQMELCYGILRELCEHFPIRKTGSSTLLRVSRFRPVFDYVRAHLGESITVEQMARAASLSPSRFFPLFKRAMQLSPMAYVQKARLARARELLQDDRSTIAHVAEAVGFMNQFHFSRIFKTHFGMAPRVYRRRFALSPPSS